MYGPILRKLRESKGRPQAEVARKVGISPAQLARLERNQRGLYVEDFVSIAEVLGEKPGNLLPNDLGHIGHLKPLIDRLSRLQPEFLGRVESIVEKIVLLTDDVFTTAKLQKAQPELANGGVNGSIRERRRKMSAEDVAAIARVLAATTVETSEIPKWARKKGATGSLVALAASTRDVGIFAGDIMYIKPDENPARGNLVIGTLNNRLFVKILKRDKSGRPVQLGSKSPEVAAIDIQADDKLVFYCVVVGISGQR